MSKKAEAQMGTTHEADGVSTHRLWALAMARIASSEKRLPLRDALRDAAKEIAELGDVAVLDVSDGRVREYDAPISGHISRKKKYTERVVIDGDLWAQTVDIVVSNEPHE
jgi:hypothetical protein